jgi:aminoglycoside phosphotransferase (APT) family kinase protein
MGELDGRRVKVYEAYSTAHAEFIAAATRVDVCSSFLPSVIRLEGPFVFSEWTEGKTARDTTPEALANMLAAVHRVPVANLPACDFDYWHDLVEPRFLRTAAILGRSRLAQTDVARVSEMWDARPGFLSHPDLTPHNIIQNSVGRRVVIDNEFLSIGRIPLLDLCNAVSTFSPRDRQRTFDVWRDFGVAPSKDELDVVSAAWMARTTGSAFVSGELSRAAGLIDLYLESFHNILPFSRY